MSHSPLKITIVILLVLVKFFANTLVYKEQSATYGRQLVTQAMVLHKMKLGTVGQIR